MSDRDENFERALLRADIKAGNTSKPYGAFGTMPGDHLGLCPCGHRDAMCHKANARRWCSDGTTWVHGRCPMGCGETLFLGAGGHVTCSFIDCPNPSAADELLDAAVPTPESENA